MRKEYHSALFNEGFSKICHCSGLTIYMYPIINDIYSSAYLAVNYGSLDDYISKNEKISKLPQGVAHFIEHMLIENSSDNTSLFSSTGAIANAYCTYDRTVYYFSCIDKFRDNLQIMLNSILMPDFDNSLIDSTRSVIVQEIKQNRLSGIADINLLDCLYYSDALKAPIAGTEQSVQKININLLWEVYNAAYHPENMVLVVAGHFDENTVLDVINFTLKNQTNKSSVKFIQHEQEPLNIKKDIMKFKIHGITSPFFCIGFKETPVKYSESLYCAILDEMLVEMLVGKISSTYQELYNKGIINMPLIHESMCRRGYAFNKLSGESENPANIIIKLKRAIKNARETGFNLNYFQYCRKALIGRYIFYFDDISILANYIILSHFSGTDIYSLFEYIRNINREQVEKRLLEVFNLERCAISIVEPVS